MSLGTEHEVEVAHQRCGLDVVGLGLGDGAVVGERAVEVARVHLVLGGDHARIVGDLLLCLGGRSPSERTADLGEDLIDPVDDLGLRTRAIESGDGLTGGECDNRRNRLHTEGLRDLRVRVDIDLGEDPGAARGVGELLQHRRQLLTRTAPLRPEVDQDKLSRRAGEDLGLEGRVRHVDHVAAGRRRSSAGPLGCRGGLTRLRSLRLGLLLQCGEVDCT